MQYTQARFQRGGGKACTYPLPKILKNKIVLGMYNMNITIYWIKFFLLYRGQVANILLLLFRIMLQFRHLSLKYEDNFALKSIINGNDFYRSSAYYLIIHKGHYL